MIVAALVWGSPDWLAGALALCVAAAVVLLLAYWRAPSSRGLRLAAGSLKAVAIVALGLCLLEPLLTGTKPRRGANTFVLLADNSQSMRIGDGSPARPRADLLREQLTGDASWKSRLGQDFDVRNYVFDSHMRAVAGFNALDFDGESSALQSSLTTVAKRFRGLPLAGVLLFTDGNGTDLTDVDWSELPPVFPVLPKADAAPRDVNLQSLAASQTNFESAPVLVRADVSGAGVPGQEVAAVLIDESGREVERQRASLGEDGKPTAFRFQLRPDKPGVSFYTVQASLSSEAGEALQPEVERTTSEQTLANNSRIFVVDRGGGPYRVLYVSGRPNWEFKFLRRAVHEDDQVNLVGLIRIAKRQPKFGFRDARARRDNQLFEGFDNPEVDTAERHDEPVLIRLGLEEDDKEGVELRVGFPKAADELYRYDAIVLDDIEAEFFTQDQLTLLRSFVSQRGGGLLMMGGPDSFTAGKYDRTPVGELLPVYLDHGQDGASPLDGEYRLALTREGWLQPWVRTRETEDAERQRLLAMPAFRSISGARAIKPGASVLAEVSDGEATYPALVAQRFGKGRAGAMLLGDYWRWNLQREQPEEDDFDRAWRQTVRWLVSDVPKRVEVETQRKKESASPATEIAVRVRDAEFLPLDNAQVSICITGPDGKPITLAGEPDDREPGLYSTTYVAREPGAYRATVTANAPDGSEIAKREAGWTAQPAAEEFARLAPNRELLATIAAKTGGEIVEVDGLSAFVSGLSRRKAPVTEPWVYPLWQHPLYFLTAILCLAGEWGLRRWHGLA
ncbi:MAG: glutamine amidotransferase [Planctomycetia bacterium]|nr:glutamine amidotransferase [Planctomycetia bacterium]